MRVVLTISLLLTLEFCYGQNKSEVKTFETRCDSIYKNKGYRVVLQHFPDGIGANSDVNTVFQFIRTAGKEREIVHQDTIYSRTGEIEFKDFNNDGVKDLLIQNTSDVRSNWTYYLYLVDSLNNNLKKVKGFDEIKNPRYLSRYHLIDNYVNSGRNWTSFYRIVNDTIKDLKIVIYDDQNNDDKSTYEQEYKKAIAKIVAETSR
ncbi:hypothetical protein WBG78_09885 [Chryseolinea sp. T2]|uniref:XAC2610-related protein n=1 Tax=Chryseolinea sp. T2 TaxID=3129255 RepID=UPI003077ECF9